MAERLRNLGRFTFADITSYRLDQGKVRTMAAISSLTVVCFYLIAQMVGAGQLIRLLFGLDYKVAMIAVGALMMVYVIFGGMIATTWVQIIKAVLLLGGTLVMLLAMSRFGFSYRRWSSAPRRHKLGLAIIAPGSLLADPVSAISLRSGSCSGRRACRTSSCASSRSRNAKEARKSRPLRLRVHRLLLQRHLPLGLAASSSSGRTDRFFEGGGSGSSSAAGTWSPCTSRAPSAATSSSASSPRWRSPRSWRSCRGSRSRARPRSRTTSIQT